MLSRPLVSIDAVHPTSVRLSWDATVGASSYVVQYADGVSGVTLGSLAVDATVVDIYQLTPATKYAAVVYSVHRTLRSTGFKVVFTTPGITLVESLPCGGSELYPSAILLPETDEHALLRSAIGYTYGGADDGADDGIVTNPRDTNIGGGGASPYYYYYKFALFHAGRILTATTRIALQILTPGGAWSTDSAGALRATILQVALVFDDGARRSQWYDANSPFLLGGTDAANGCRCCLARDEQASTSYRVVTFGRDIVKPGTDVFVRVGLPRDGRVLAGVRLAGGIGR